MNNTEDTNDTQLPVVAYHVKYRAGEFLDWSNKWGSDADTKGLSYTADAQALLAEKDARIAQLAAHARGKNKALANALKEIERLKKGIDYLRDNLEAAYEDRKELRAQLEQLQAAPAERELAVLREYRLSAIAFNNSHGWEPDTLEEAVELERKAEERLEAAEKACWEFYRLNPAPATADSDVREVKK